MRLTIFNIFLEKLTEEVLKKNSAEAKDLLLDIGTGGGEAILKIAYKVGFIYGIDHSVSMVTTARNNLKKLNYCKLNYLYNIFLTFVL